MLDLLVCVSILDSLKIILQFVRMNLISVCCVLEFQSHINSYSSFYKQLFNISQILFVSTLFHLNFVNICTTTLPLYLQNSARPFSVFSNHFKIGGVPKHLIEFNNDCGYADINKIQKCLTHCNIVNNYKKTI